MLMLLSPVTTRLSERRAGHLKQIRLLPYSRLRKINCCSDTCWKMMLWGKLLRSPFITWTWICLRSWRTAFPGDRPHLIAVFLSTVGEQEQVLVFNVSPENVHDKYCLTNWKESGIRAFRTLQSCLFGSAWALRWARLGFKAGDLWELLVPGSCVSLQLHVPTRI